MAQKIQRLNLFYRKVIGKSLSYKYYCKSKSKSKSKSYRANFSDTQFCHVNFRGAIMTSCSFKRCCFEGVEFLGTNLRKSNFEGANFKDCIFVAALLDGSKFKNSTFDNVIFVNTNTSGAKGFNTKNKQLTILQKYPHLELDSELKEVLEKLKDNHYITKCKVLHLSTKKYNHLSLKILRDIFTQEELIQGLRIARDKVNKDICTLSCLVKFLRKELSMC